MVDQNAPDQNFIELSWIIALVRRWWWLIFGLALLGAILAYIVTALIPPVYRSSVLLLVNPSKSSNTSQYNDLMAGTQLAITYSQMVKDRPVLDTVVTELGLKQSADELAEQITAEPVRSSQIIKLTVEDSDATQSALIANTLAQAFTKRVEELSALRYAGVLKSTKERAQDLQAQTLDLQTQIDALRSQKVSKDVSLGNKQTLLITQQSDYRSLQNSYLSLQNSIADITGKVYIFEPVQVQKNVPKAASIASVVVFVGQSPQNGGSSPSGDPLTQTYGQLINNPQLLQSVIDELGMTVTPEQVSAKVSFELVPGTQLIRFKFEDPDELKAQLVLQTMVNAFLERVKAMLVEPYAERLGSMQKQIADMEASINSNQAEISALISDNAQLVADLNRLDTDLSMVRTDYRDAVQKYDQLQATAAETSDAVIITEPAQAPKSPSQNRLLYIVLAGILGMAAGSGLAFLLNYIKTQIRTNQDVRSVLKMPVLSTIGQKARHEHDLVMVSAPSSSMAEDFRILGQRIRLYRENNAVKTLLITSPVPSEGKSMIASNLAISLAKTGLRVIIVDGDLRLPRQHNLFGLPQEYGLSNALNTGIVNGSLKATEIDELRILTSGKVPPNPAEMLSTPYLDQLLHDLKLTSDLVIIDCPPVLIASDASILASKVDGVLLVLRAGSTETGAAQDAVDALRQVKANLVGIVLNSIPNRRSSYYYRA